jgi:hypothetical protein
LLLGFGHCLPVEDLHWIIAMTIVCNWQDTWSTPTFTARLTLWRKKSKSLVHQWYWWSHVTTIAQSVCSPFKWKPW